MVGDGGRVRFWVEKVVMSRVVFHMVVSEDLGSQQ